MGCDNFHHRRKDNKLGRKSKKKEILPFYLIVCEGEKTEPKYFEWYKKNCKQYINININGEGKNTLSLVQKTYELKKKIEKEESIKFDKVWSIFDRDSFSQQNYNNAMDYAKKMGIETAYSNECFELWYLLHFNYYNTSMDRDTMFSKLDEQLKKHKGICYEKNNPDMYELLCDKQDIAIKNAIRLEKSIQIFDKWNHNPSTSIYILINELNKYVNKNC